MSVYDIVKIRKYRNGMYFYFIQIDILTIIVNTLDSHDIKIG